MRTPSRPIIGFVLVFSLLRSAIAQDNKAAKPQHSAVTITASASGEHVRFTAPSSIVQTRLEVYNSAGKKVFDNEMRGGNVLDWHLQDGQADPLADGAYLCVVTVKSLSGKLSERIASVTIENMFASVQSVDPSQITAQLSQIVGPAEENASLTVLKEDETRTTTVIAHNGEEGQITRGRGALSFRIGDFYTGKDTEQMLLTQEGNLGIGITHPKARLDVDGVIRTTQGILFPDGTVQTTAANAASSGSRPDPNLMSGKLLGSTSQSISSGQAANGKKKFKPDLFVNEDLTVNGNIIFTSPLPQAFQRDITVQDNTGGLRFFGAPALTTSPAAAAIQFWGTNSPFQGQLYLDSGAHDNSAVIIRTTGTGGTITERMRVTATGNVGLGTATPHGRLEVVGNGASVVIGDPNCGAGSTTVAIGFLSGANLDCGNNYSFGGNTSLKATFINRPFAQLTRGSSGIYFVEGNGPGQMKIAAGGDVGIGTTDPAARLHVLGPSPVRILGDTTTLSGTESVDFMARSSIFSSDLGGMRIQRQGNGNIDTIFLAASAGSSASEVMRAAGSGNVGIGTTTPQARVHAVGGFGGVGVLGETGSGVGIGVKGQANFNANVESIGGQFSNPGNTAAIAIRADGNAVQSLDDGGWVKAMAFVTPGDGIVSCYNSQATGLTRSLPPCGFTFNYLGQGSYYIDFGFRVDDRFISVTSLNTVPVSVFGLQLTVGGRVFIVNQQAASGDLVDTSFYISVY